MISLITAGIGLLVATAILLLIRRDQLHVRHGAGWIIVALMFAGLGFAPSLVDWVARLVGIAYPPALAFVVAIAVLLIKILLMDIERARQEVQLQRLVQRVAMLEADLRQHIAPDDDLSP